MNIYGIIAEYNPFHNGHLYQIKEIKKDKKRSFLIVIMSGYFCQRGEPAIISPRSRTEIALEHGADLVLQIPTYASLGSAELFASTATRLLAATGICNSLVFGTEQKQLNKLEKIAELLSMEKDNMWLFIEEELKTGVSYAKARENFVSLYLGQDTANLLQESNQILAIEYLKTIKQYNLNLQTKLIQRKGDSYLADHLLNQTFASAKAIRKTIFESETNKNFLYKTIEQLKPYLPTKSLATLAFDLSVKSFLSMEKMAHLYYLSLEVAHAPQTRYMNEALFNRLKKEVRFCNHQYLAIDTLCEKVSTKQLPITRVKRALTNLLLNINQEKSFKPSYLHVLGFNRDGRYLLKRMRDKASLPIITNFSDLNKHLNEEDKWQEQVELSASRIWLNTAKQPLNQVFDSPLLMR